jgi:acyl transferase domain-containing protein/acyl carrier protein
VKLDENSKCLQVDGAPEPIAIVGIGCRYPGASGPDDFWRLLCDGGDAIAEIPPERFDVAAFHTARPRTPGRTASAWGGLLEDVEGFDAGFFGIAPREALYIDPQHRLLLEVAWEALEDAGEHPDRLAGSATGVFVGETSSDYGELVAADPARIDSVYMITGSGRGINSGRLSFALDLRGPSVTLDAACASSLLAVHLACRSIWQGDSTMAFAGGTNLVLVPHGAVGFSQAGMAALDGRCKAFSEEGDGFVRSDGIGVVLLKPLDRARAEGNQIYAVIRGTGSSNDGRSSGLLMSPGREGQEAALRAAYRQANIDPRVVQYVEAHGTGTVAGDPVEIAALNAVVGLERAEGPPCLLGSVKTNIGHTEAAAGIAGLIKTALCIHHRKIPPSLHSAQLNTAIDWDALPFAVPQELTPWPADGRAVAGVNSFGISGSNVHVVLEAAPDAAKSQSPKEPGPVLLPLSARSPAALGELVSSYASLISSTAKDPTAFSAIAAAAALRRAHHDHRLAIVADTSDDAVRQMQVLAAGSAKSWTRTRANKRKVAFVFPGQGGQWRGMGRQLLRQEPAFAAAIQRCDEAMQPFTEWSLLEHLTSVGDESTWGGVERVQPTIFAIQVALTDLWRSWGIEPDALIGHSMGEVAAAHAAGALSLDYAAQVICRRSELLIPLAGRGGMALIGLSMDETEDALRPYAGEVSVAVSNSPAATVVSGGTAALRKMISRLETDGVFCRLIDVDFASHSPQIDDLRESLLQALSGITPNQGTLPIYSTVTTAVTDGANFDATYWLRNLRQPVLFAPAVERAAQDGHDIFVEISPSPVLSGAMLQICRDRWPQVVTVPSTRRDADERIALLESLGRLYELGQQVRWEALYPESSGTVALPRYPWQRERFWAPTADQWKPGRVPESLAGGRRRADGSLAHPLLGQHFQSAFSPELHSFRTIIGPTLMAYLRDHRVQDVAVLPAAASIEMALAAAAEVFESTDVELRDVAFLRPIALEHESATAIRLELSVEPGARAAFAIFLDGADHGAVREPVPHVRGMLQIGRDETNPSVNLEPIHEVCAESVLGEDYYRFLARAGLTYGPAFRGIQMVQRGDGEALGTIVAPDLAEADSERYLIHPALLDACLQVLPAATAGELDETAAIDTYVPINVKRVCFAGAQASRLLSHARTSAEETGPDQMTGDVTIVDTAGRVVLAVEGFAAARIDRPGLRRVEDWIYSLDWEPTPLEETPHPPVGNWLILADGGGVGDALIASLEGEGGVCVKVSHSTTSEPITARHRQLEPADERGWRALLRDVLEAGPLRGIVHLWSLDVPERDALTTDTLRTDQALACTSVLRLVQALQAVGAESVPQLILVTAGAQSSTDDAGPVAVGQAPLWGLGRAIDYEHPELRCVLVDLDHAAVPAAAQTLSRELRLSSDERQVLLRGTERYVARMAGRNSEALGERGSTKPKSTAGASSFALGTRASGLLDNLEWQEASRRPPAPDEVEIEVFAAGLNFNDVLGALGVRLGDAAEQYEAGYECSGKILAIGEAVTGLAVGDEVIAATHPCLGSHVTTLSQLVVPKPSGLDFEAAAGLPVAFVTAHHALLSLARLRPDDRVLIHAAAGGVGLAAVQIAQAIGANVFATAGNPDKRAYLRSLGIEHIFDSRSLIFADEVRELTDGRGVDVVLNSLGGEAIERSLDALARFGRFVEIGKRDLYEHNRRLGMHHFQKSVSFFTVDLKALGEERPQHAGELLREALSFYEKHSLKPLPVRSFPPAEVVDAFRHMSQARHIGKVAIDLRGQEAEIATSSTTAFRADSTYLIAGGMGGIGLVVARWMVERGAEHLVLVGRSEPSAATRERLADLQRLGANVTVMRADISDAAQVDSMIKKIRRRLPPLRGVVHAAAVLDDGIVVEQTEDRLLSVLAPKVLGAWNLHRATLADPLDIFVLFSSAAGVFGSPGQSNYCAGNTFLDALSHHRSALGLPSLSISWGNWGEVGLAAESDDRGRRLAARGLPSMAPKSGLQAFGRVLTAATPHIAVVPFDYARWCDFYPRARSEPVFTRLREIHGMSHQGMGAVARQAIEAAEPGERRALVEAYLRERVGKILGYAEDRVDPERDLRGLGLDSLMAVELRNAVETELGMTAPSMTFLSGGTISELAEAILDERAVDVMAPAVDEPQLDNLSDQEVDDLLQAIESGTVTD